VAFGSAENALAIKSRDGLTVELERNRAGLLVHGTALLGDALVLV